MQADITDARGIVVESRKLRLSAAGFEELNYTTQESAPTGGWNVNLYIVKDGKTDAQIGSVALQIKEFTPDRMKAEARLSQNVVEGWIKPDGPESAVHSAESFRNACAESSRRGHAESATVFP